MTLHRDRLRLRGDDRSIRDQPVAAERWEVELRTWFEMSIPTAWLHERIAGARSHL